MLLYSKPMTRVLPVLCAAIPALIVPAEAQQAGQDISASEFVEAQIAIIQGMTGLLTIKGIEKEAPTVEKEAPTVAAGINQLAGMIQQLAPLKPAASAQDIAIIETELADKARTSAAALQRALETTVENNFYNSPELAEAVQNFVAAFRMLK